MHGVGADEDIDFICTGFIIKKNGMIQKQVIPDVKCSKRDLQIKLLNQNSFFGTGSNIICKRELVEKINGFDQAFARHQDMEFVIRYLEVANKVYCIKNYTVIKNCDDSINVPTFSKMLEIKEMYLNKFRYIINNLSNDKKESILNNNYYELLSNAYISKNKNDIKECRIFLRSIGRYSKIKNFKIYLKCMLKKLYITKKIRSIIKL